MRACVQEMVSSISQKRTNDVYTLNETERNWKEPCWATLWPSSRLYNVGLQKFGFHQLKYHLIICVCMWVSVQCTNWKGNRCEQKKKIYWSFCPIYHIFRYCSLLLWMMCGCLSIPFLHTVCDLFVLAVGSGCLCSLEIYFFILSLMLSFLKGRWCTKKHMHIYSLSIYDQWVYLCFDWIVRLLSWTLEMNEETAKAENVDRKICYWNCCGAETNE